MYKMLLWSILFRLGGIFIAPIISSICIALGRDKFFSFFHVLDNDEDGFDGDKRGWYSNYLGVDIRSKNYFYRCYRSCRWNWRNQAFNHRYDDRCSVCVNPKQEPSFKIISFEGNTYHHEQRYSHEPSVRDKKWYKMIVEVKGKRHTSEFSLTPINGNEYEYKRKGLKIYPFYYFDKWWLNKIEKEGWPPHKDRAVYSSISRVRKYKEEGA